MLLKILVLMFVLWEDSSIWSCRDRAGTSSASTTTTVVTSPCAEKPPPCSCTSGTHIPEDICGKLSSEKFVRWNSIAHRSPRRNFTKVNKPVGPFINPSGMKSVQGLNDPVVIQLGLISRPTAFNNWTLDSFDDWLSHEETRDFIRNVQSSLRTPKRHYAHNNA